MMSPCELMSRCLFCPTSSPLTTFQLCLGLLRGGSVSDEQRAVMLEAEVGAVT